MNKDYMMHFLFYFIVAFVFLLIAGLTFRACLGFGLVIGFIFGILNQIHSDLMDLNNNKKE